MYNPTLQRESFSYWVIELIAKSAAFFFLPWPDMCPFQELHYSITIQQITDPNNTTLSDAADNIIVIGPKTVVGHTTAYEVVNSSLVVDAVYN